MSYRADKQDLRWRRYLAWTQRAGATAALKRRINRHDRRQSRADIRRQQTE